ncbi:MAG TPA: polymer-forming cytoskeletal protein [Steroidobacteraceae bacterium]|nr:polymer-forming cytoskeletal protein [Steroidobacteraceae bacterium]
MALWKDTTSGSPGPAPAQNLASAATVPLSRDQDKTEKLNVAPLAPEPARRPVVKESQRLDMKESVIASDLTIEGKIVGNGHIRIAGRFKGDVQVDGNVTLDTGAHLEGQVRANAVVVGGELVGNIENAKRVELLDGGVISGDVKAGSLTVAAGSRMRGQVEFGWEGEATRKTDTKGYGTGS